MTSGRCLAPWRPWSSWLPGARTSRGRRCPDRDHVRQALGPVDCDGLAGQSEHWDSRAMLRSSIISERAPSESAHRKAMSKPFGHAEALLGRCNPLCGTLTAKVDAHLPG